MFNKRITCLLCMIVSRVICMTSAVLPETNEKKKLKVFILAGQSNMVGMAKIATIDYIGDDP